MKILVTGATGFLGQHLQEAFRPHQVEHQIIFPSSQELNLVTHEYADIFFSNLVENVDVIIHGAALCGGILANKNSPYTFLASNLLMGLNIFAMCITNNVKKMYTLGSVCSYPKFCPTPFKEDDIWNGAPEETNAPYGMAKRTLIMLGNSCRTQFGVGGAHLIPVNMYGEYDHFDLTNSHVIPALINKFTTAVKENKPTVECWGTGMATREFLYAGDAAQAIVKAVMTGLDTELPINIGTGHEISIKGLAYLIAHLTGFVGEIVFTGEVSDGQPKRQLDVTRAKDLLGFVASTDLEQGLRKTIKWYLEQR